ncbi:FAD binding domain protein [Teladorsagia circumcincta]|uniref:D-2-hydroxyglutarate dehydrogenase, mitochondrial n=1 Tax=Teladorsagia circumcincta TaxID=45464 RepID=A0A2G9UAU1_TELCI|nr:FAD binding domain protein [Teladorsagia circumcincta]
MLKTLARSVRRLASSARNPSFAKVETSDLRVIRHASCCHRLPRRSQPYWPTVRKDESPSFHKAGTLGRHGFDDHRWARPFIVLGMWHCRFIGILSCDAGMILEELDNRVGLHGYMMPYDLGAKGSCMIGGNVATSAGGIRLLRYGSLHAHLMGLTAVLPTEEGTVVELGSAHRKDNTSLHTPHLFLGSEGQLGVITRVVMSATPKPASVQSAMLGVDTFESCCEVLRLAKRHLSEILSSFEFLDREAMVILDEALGLKPVLQSNPRFTILVETSG